MNKTRIIKIRVSDTEHAAIAKLAKPVGGVSALVRNSLEAAGLPSAPKVDALRELSRFSALLSVLARHSMGHAPTDDIEIIARLVALDRQVTDLVKTLATK